MYHRDITNQMLNLTISNKGANRQTVKTKRRRKRPPRKLTNAIKFVGGDTMTREDNRMFTKISTNVTPESYEIHKHPIPPRDWLINGVRLLIKPKQPPIAKSRLTQLSQPVIFAKTGKVEHVPRSLLRPAILPNRPRSVSNLKNLPEDEYEQLVCPVSAPVSRAQSGTRDREMHEFVGDKQGELTHMSQNVNMMSFPRFSTLEKRRRPPLTAEVLDKCRYLFSCSDVDLD